MTPHPALLAVLLAAVSSCASAQAPAGASDTSSNDPALAQQIEQLRRQLKDLEILMDVKSPPNEGMRLGGTRTPQPMAGMPPAGISLTLAGLPFVAPTASGAMPQPSPSWDCSDCLGEMGAVVSMSGASGMPNGSALPGFPGTSHIYHVGADDFFLSHAHHIGLTVGQQAKLSRTREQALLARAGAARALEEADQKLFVLTGADQPDADQIEAQIRRIEALRTARRLAHIRAVGEAAQVLSDEQRRGVLGAVP
ncbi:MAG: periplasmic heavy metal sensor [Sinimarinibacterium sp.]